MRRDEFTSEAAVTIRRHPTDYIAAHPNKLPPAITASWELFQALSAADRALSELAGVARTLPNPHLLISPFLRKEAVLSSKIEGTQASLSDLLLFEASRGAVQRTNDVNQVAAYVDAVKYALDALKTLPFSLRLLRDIHRILITDPTKTPGEFRVSQNWIGPDGCNLHDASYVPPPPENLLEHMADLELYLHQEGKLPPLLKYAIVHYQFESIHPFLDGNGRLGRLLITLLLCSDPTLEHPLLPLPLLYLSAYLEQYREEYYKRLDAVTKHGAWLEWLVFFLEGVTTQSRDAVIRSDKLFALRRQYLSQAHEARASALVHQIVESLFVTPVLTVSGVASSFGRTYAGAQHAVKKLVTLGILRELQGSAPRLFVAEGVIQAVEN